MEFAITFILLSHFIESMGLFDIFKDKDEDEGSGGMAEETPSFESEPEPVLRCSIPRYQILVR